MKKSHNRTHSHFECRLHATSRNIQPASKPNTIADVAACCKISHLGNIFLIIICMSQVVNRYAISVYYVSISIYTWIIRSIKCIYLFFTIYIIWCSINMQPTNWCYSAQTRCGRGFDCMLSILNIYIHIPRKRAVVAVLRVCNVFYDT